MKTEIEIIQEIMKNHPKNEWLEQCKKALPNVEEKALLAMFEMLNGS
ncbi:MAG: hypothetical protein KAT04_15035 [Methylococcales bacterium]|nr:hypothetical protein [Methylococcales bacterium]